MLTKGDALGRLVVDDARLERDIGRGSHDLQTNPYFWLAQMLDFGDGLSWIGCG